MTDLVFIDDLQLANNDLAVAESTQQHTEHLLITEPGAILEDASVGVGIENFINGNADGLLKKITEQLEYDGQKVQSISFDEQTGNLNIDGSY